MHVNCGLHVESIPVSLALSMSESPSFFKNSKKSPSDIVTENTIVDSPIDSERMHGTMFTCMHNVNSIHGKKST